MKQMKMQQRVLLTLSAFAVLGTACKKDHHNEDFDYFTFGRSYGMCAGDCAEFYKIENGKLYADNSTTYYGATIVYQTTALPNGDYALAESLPDDLPTFLDNNPNTTQGCPDCADQGLIEVRISRNGVVTEWKLDNNVDENPQDVRAYTQQLQQVLDQLQ